MWATSNIFNKILDKLLLVLLKLHLASSRSHNYAQFMRRKKRRVQIAHKSATNVKFCTLREKKLNKLKQKLQTVRADEQAKVLEKLDRSQVRVQYFKSLPTFIVCSSILYEP